MRAAEVFEGKPCPHGHTLRYTTGKRRCVECTRAYRLRWYRADPDARVAYHAEYRDQNREQYRETARAYERRNRASRNERTRIYYIETADDRRAYSKQYWKARPEEARRHSSLRRGRLRGLPGTFTVSQVDAILAAQGGHCAYCDVRNDLHLDHVIPVTRDGSSNWPWNLQWLCAHHNISKSDRTDAEYRALIGLPAVEPVSTVIWRNFFRVSLLPVLG